PVLFRESGLATRHRRRRSDRSTPSEARGRSDGRYRAPCLVSAVGAAARSSGWASRAPTLPSPAGRGGRCDNWFDAEPIERHVKMTQIERGIEELRQLGVGQPLAHLGALPDDGLEVLSSIE